MAVVWLGVALLADTIHNAADACTALPLWVAFTLARWPPSKRFPYGYGRPRTWQVWRSCSPLC